MTLAMTRSSNPGSVFTNGSASGPLRWNALHRPGDDLVKADGTGQRPYSAGLKPGQVEQVVDQPLEPRRRDVDGRQQLRLVLGAPFHVGLAQAANSRADRGERSAEVVGYGREQRGSDGIALLELPSFAGLLAQPLPVEHHGRLGRERLQHAPVVGREHPPTHGQRQRRRHHHLDVRFFRRGARCRA